MPEPATADEKLEQGLAGWLSVEDKPFESAAIAQRYQRRVQRFVDVVELKEPDRVPTLIMPGGFVARYAGITLADTFYDADKTARATMKFMQDFQPELSLGGGMLPMGKVFELLGYRLYKWPGGNLPANTPFQFVEGEYMPPEDYDELISNPEGYVLRHYYPRIFENLQALKQLPSLFEPAEIVGIVKLLLPLATPQFQEMLTRIGAAIAHLRANIDGVRQSATQILGRFGMPSVACGLSFAPFDLLADSMRGTQGALMDLYRRPDKVLAACDALVGPSVRMGIAGGLPGGPFVGIPLHKGADAFMSEQQFEKFYWPSFKAQLQGIIDAGMIPLPFVEGGYNNGRLDIIASSRLPAKKTVWIFDRTDMKMAREKFRGFACIGGNVPSSLFATGTPKQMHDYCRRLIDEVAPGGGFFLAPGVVMDDARPENMHAFLDSTSKA
jgi:Uroporphyrinogen decarboxylase (URO-D)